MTRRPTPSIFDASLVRSVCQTSAPDAGETDDRRWPSVLVGVTRTDTVRDAAVADELRRLGATVAMARFGAWMRLELVNEGLVTLVLETPSDRGLAAREQGRGDL